MTITICAVSIGASTALAMNKMSQSATPYDLNVLSNVSVDGDSDISAYLAAHDITISNYAKEMCIRDRVYTAPLAAGTTLEDIYRTFNVDHPADFKGHSLSVSDVVVLHQKDVYKRQHQGRA